jgi:NAD(P)H-quinone oxidoreductase subunit 5
MLRGAVAPSALSVALAPVLTLLAVVAVPAALGGAAWPAWWSVVLALAWAPVLWQPSASSSGWRAAATHLLSGFALAAALTALAHLAHALPLRLVDAPATVLGLVAAAGMAWLYLCLAAVQLRPQALSVWRRWSYAGFYLDEFTTRLALRVWPTRWTAQARTARADGAAEALAWGTPR